MGRLVPEISHADISACHRVYVGWAGKEKVIRPSTGAGSTVRSSILRSNAPIRPVYDEGDKGYRPLAAADTGNGVG